MKIIPVWGLAGLCALFTCPAFGQNLFVDSTYGYQTLMPSGWFWENDSAGLGIYMFDTANGANSILSITPAALNGSIPEEWTRTSFIAFKTDIDSGIEYISAMLYYDSSQSAKVDGYWAPEAFATFEIEDFYIMEYVTYVSANGNGYVLSAVGDTSDMRINISNYSSILRSTTFFQPKAIAHIKRNFKRHSLLHKNKNGTNIIYDITGRAICKAGILSAQQKKRLRRRGRILLHPASGK